MRGFILSALLHGSAVVVAAQNPVLLSEGPFDATIRNPLITETTQNTLIDAATRNTVIDAALQTLTAAYVFPEAATQMEDAIRERQRRGDYESLTNAREFARLLTEHLREVSRDLHLAVTVEESNPPPPPPPPGGE